MKFVVQLLRDDRIEGRTVVNEEDVCVTLCRVKICEHSMNGCVGCVSINGEGKQ